jgi:hypothetical protein
MSQLPTGLNAPRPQSIHSILTILHDDGNRLTYRCLVTVWRKGLRNGNWSRLDVSDKSLIRCALWMAKIKGSICNMRLMVQVLSVLLRLVRNRRSRIIDAGNRRAHAMLRTYGEGPKSVFSWVPQLREWLWDAGYIRYLGLLEVNR